MGEYADDYIDNMIGGGRNDRPHRVRDLPHPRCRHCGKPNLRWKRIKGGVWRLHTKDGTLHECYETFGSAPSSIADFENLT